MGKRIKWDYEMTNEKIIEARKNIDLFERNISIRFPNKYKDIVSNYSSATPEIETNDEEFVEGMIKFPLGFDPEGISFISFYNQEIKGEITNKMTVSYKYTRKMLIDNIFTFAATGGGDLYLFDFTNSKNDPKICFIKHENMYEKDTIDIVELQGGSINKFIYSNMIFLAETFDELLELIIPCED